MRYFMNYGISKLVPGLMNYSIILISIRELTLVEYGEYSYILSLLTLLCSFLFPWIRINITRNFIESKKKNEDKNFINLSFTLYLISTIIFLFISLSFNVENKFLLILGIIALVLEYFFEQQSTYLRAELKSQLYMFLLLSKSVIRLIVFLMCFYVFSLGANSIFLALVISNILAIFLWINHIYFPSKLHFKLDKTKEFMEYGIPLMLSSVMIFILNSSNRLFLEKYRDTTEVGIYSSYYDSISFIFINVFVFINMAFFPLLIKYKSQSKIYKELTLNYSFLNMVTAFFMFLIFSFYSIEFIELILKTEVDRRLMILVAFSIYLNGIKSYLIDSNFHLSKKTKLQTITVLIAAIISLILNSLFIPHYGTLGAAYSSIFSVLVGVMVALLLIKPNPEIYFEAKKIIINSVIVLFGTSIFYLVYKFYIDTALGLVLSLVLTTTLFCVVLLKNVDYKLLLKLTKKEEA